MRIYFECRQEQFQKARLEGQSADALPFSVNIKRMGAKTNPMVVPKVPKSEKNQTKKLFNRKKYGRFTLDLEAVQEESTTIVLSDVQEKNTGYLDGSNEKAFTFCGLSNGYSKDEGFPDVLDLSRYYLPDSSGKVLETPAKADGRSFFAIEFDRLNGKLDLNDAYDDERLKNKSIGSDAEEEDEDVEADISDENTKRIKAMSQEEILSAQREIVERFDPKLIEFLKNRYSSKKRTNDNDSGKTNQTNRKESRFKQIREMGNKQHPKATTTTSSGDDDDVKEEVSDTINEMIVEEKVKELEIFPTDLNEMTAGTVQDDMTSTKTTAHTRLAIEAVQLDFANKCLRTIAPRQQQNILRLFDSFTKRPDGYEGNDELLEMARTNIPAIKGLFLEEMNTEKGTMTYRFADGLNPITDGAWTLLPIRNVLDNYHQDYQITVEDIVLIRLCMLLTLLMMTEKGSLFHACNKVEDVYVRLSEMFLIGPQIFKDDVIARCADRILRNYIVPRAKRGNFCLTAIQSVAKLDAFLPFYEDLLRHFEDYAFGDDLFPLVLLIGAYMNASISDSLLMRSLVWSPERKIVRQISLDKNSAEFLLAHLSSTHQYWCEELEASHYVQYSQLLTMYAVAIRNAEVTRERNPLVFEIASIEIGSFVKRHSQNNRHVDDVEKIKEFGILVDIVRHAVAGKLQL